MPTVAACAWSADVSALAQALAPIRVHDVLVWSTTAIGWWLVLIVLLRRLRMPEPVAWAALLSWPVARLGMWAVPTIVHWLSVRA